MNDEMLDLARRNAREAGISNVEWLKGDIENIPPARRIVDVLISNCVINLSGDKQQVLREAARVLKPGGRFAVSDVIADPDMDDAIRADMQQWTGGARWLGAAEGGRRDALPMTARPALHPRAGGGYFRSFPRVPLPMPPAIIHTIAPIMSMHGRMNSSA